MLLFTGINLPGQDTIEIKGRVISKSGSYLPGTNVVLHNTTVGTVTDACGQFKIKIPKDRQGHLSLSMISNPFYFDLRQIKDEDLDKEVILRIMSFDEKMKMRNKKQHNLKYNCVDYKDKTITFRIPNDRSKWPGKTDK